MDKKEILDILNNAKDEMGAVPMRLVRQAFDKLVQPKERTEKRTETHACDLISRQQAIDAINHICPVDTEYDCTLLDRVDVRCVLSDLPSVQPELIEKTAYIRGFEQGRTQGMIDSQGGKK